MKRAPFCAVAAAIALSAPLEAQDIDLSRLELPPGFLDLTDITLGIDGEQTVTATGTTTFLGNVTRLLVSSAQSPDGNGRLLTLALKPTDWSLTRMLPALANPILDNLTFQYVGIVITGQDVSIPSMMLSDEELEFYGEIYQSYDFTLTLKPGINLIAAIPAETLEPDHPLNVVMDVFGIEKGVVLLQGTLGKSLMLLTNPAAAGTDIIKDLYLRAELPPMRPPGSPDWFNSGQLALELTGLPSVRLVGELNVNVQEDELMFFVAMTLARTGMTLSGGLQAVDTAGWVAPFGIEWLTLKKVVLLLGITPTGSVQLGFGGDAIFGEKDIQVAVALAISPAGVPTNFIMEGESEAGVGLADLATVQEGMARAAGRDQPRLPISALPEVAFTNLGLTFAPKPQPELDIERGMAIKGRLWLQTTPGGELTDFAGVDVNVGDEGLWVRGDIGAMDLGPLKLEETKVDLTATREEQYFILHGAADLFGARQALDVELSRSGFSFRSETVLWTYFRALLEAEASFNLRNPSFRIHGEMQNDFGEVIAPFVTDGLHTFAAGGAALLAGAGTALEELDRILADRQANVEQIRAALTELRRQADAAFAEARAVALQAQRAAAGTYRSASYWYGLYAGTSGWYPALKAQRYAQYAALITRWRIQVGIANGLLALVDARQRIVNALPPIEDNVLLRGAETALAEVRGRVQTARTNLATLEQRWSQVVAALEQGVLPLTIEQASFDAELAGLQVNGSVAWSISGTFLGLPFALERQLDFSNLADATAQFLQGLIG